MSGRRSVAPVLYGDLARWALIQADSLLFLRRLPTASVGAVVTDPPYAIGFDNQDWDGGALAKPLGFQAFSCDWGAEVRRILKPGGHLVAFGAPRTYHRMVAGLEDAGLEIRDQLLWLHASGMPKCRRLPGGLSSTLKPAYEPIALARAPLSEKTLTRNIQRHGTGGLNIDACRQLRLGREAPNGYWPSHVLLTHSPGCKPGARCEPDCAVALIDSADLPMAEPRSRLFHVSKPSRAEREAGLDNLPHSTTPIFSGKQLSHARANVHPTVKPLQLMRWLIRLIAPPGDIVLDPFAGSGSTGCAAILEGRQFIGIEREPRYVPLARARLAYWTARRVARQRSGSTSL